MHSNVIRFPIERARPAFKLGEVTRRILQWQIDRLDERRTA